MKGWKMTATLEQVGPTSMRKTGIVKHKSAAGGEIGKNKRLIRRGVNGDCVKSDRRRSSAKMIKGGAGY